MNRRKPSIVWLAALSTVIAGADVARGALVNQIANWPFNEPAGPTAFDSSGHGYNGTYHGNVAFQVPGPSGYAISVDFGYMEADNVPILASVSIIAYSKSATPVWNDNGWIISARDVNGFIIHPNQGRSTVNFYMIGNGYNFFDPIITEVPVADITAWHQYAITFAAFPDSNPAINDFDTNDGGLGTAYIDGQPVGSRIMSTERTSNYPFENIYVGEDDPRASGTQNRFGNGSIDPGVYDGALSPADILADFNAHMGVPEPSSILIASVGVLGVAYCARRRQVPIVPDER